MSQTKKKRLDKNWRQRLRPGDIVEVELDGGLRVTRKVRSAQWQLGHGTWVILLGEISGGYSLDRIRRLTFTPTRRCRVCDCTDFDCRQCIAKTGVPCHWIEDDLCSACENTEA